jgi:RNA polymerase-binding transcription factor DksA
MLTNHELDRFREKLHALRAALDERAPSLRDEASHGAGGEDAGGLSNAPIHLGDVGSQEAEAAVNVGLAENEFAIRRELDDALQRLDDGTFGVCEDCRREIGLERLQAVPYSRLCIRCAERSQRQGRS